jgi:signal transduction histidine kinase
MTGRLVTSQNREEPADVAALPVSARFMLDSLTSGILAIDPERRVLFINAALAKRIRTDANTCVGTPAEDLFCSVAFGMPAQQLPLYRLSSQRNKSRIRSREVQWIEGTRLVHLREDSGPLRDASGNVVGQLFAYHDLSWEKTVDQMKSEFISIASHELRTPMTSIKGSVDLILNGCAGDVSSQALDLLAVAHTACDRMIRLINDILDLSKIEAGQIGLKLASLALADAVGQALRTLQPLARQDHITIRLTAPDNLPEVWADRDRVEQVATNLVSNAIKFSPSAGVIDVELWSDSEYVYCKVSDQGCGIKEEDLDRIFGKFQQVGPPQRGKGTGLGLAISHGLVTEHGGKIWAESEVGQGSRFIFCLPLHGRRPIAASAAESQ